jgi:glucose/arabinose dehydrogenase
VTARLRPPLALAIAPVAALPPLAAAQNIAARHIASGLGTPVWAGSPPGDRRRLFIVECRSPVTGTRGDIAILNLATSEVLPQPFLTLENLPQGEEQGLLGLAFDPHYAANGRFYIHYTDGAGSVRIVRYTVSTENPNLADPSSATDVLVIPHPLDTHNGGWLAFGADNNRYISIGDGGGVGDPEGDAQNPANLLGKILRIDVSSLPYTIPPTNPLASTPGARAEIWAMGLRNPWRPGFDRQTHDVWITDVGQESWEEINFQPFTVAPAQPANYGWNCREAYTPYPGGDCPGGAALTDPIYAYPHGGATGACAIVGGFVYRGCAMPWLRGQYFFGDFCSGHIYSMVRSISGEVIVADRTVQLRIPGGPEPALLTSFGEDDAGELYYMDAIGDLFTIVPACPANCDNSTEPPVLNILDFNCFINRFAAADCYANCDGSTAPPLLNVLDFNCFLNRFTTGCP